MEEKEQKNRLRRMNKQEFNYNKHLLKEINNKRKESNYEGLSRADEESNAEAIWSCDF